MTAFMPLFHAPLVKERLELLAEREALRARLLELPLKSHRRIELQGQLRGLTERLIRTEIKLNERERDRDDY